MSWSELSETMADFQRLFPDPIPITVETHLEAVMIAQEYGFHIYDAIVISAARQASCDILYSEDMQDGQVIKGTTIRNLFRSAVSVSTQP